MPPKANKQKKPAQFHLSRDNVGAEDKSLQSTDVPKNPTNQMLDDFENRFGPNTLATVKTTLGDRMRPMSQGANSMARILRSKVKPQTTPIARDINRLSDPHLRSMFSAVLVVGLSEFCSNILGSPESAYNKVHQMACIAAFQFVAAAFGFSHMKIDRIYTRIVGVGVVESH
ncbi:hypothetical protein K438DRAFT_1762561 [Mycena galopus ATCC 62051]|nr:hypothetical protein K438DRAFT_1762561 [Mycena galopus ATCC 62051]